MMLLRKHSVSQECIQAPQHVATKREVCSVEYGPKKDSTASGIAFLFSFFFTQKVKATQLRTIWNEVVSNLTLILPEAVKELFSTLGEE